METRFSVEARERLAPIMSGDLATYLDGIGEMFREIEEYAREDGGPVYLGPISDYPTAETVRVENPWLFAYASGTRGDILWDTSVTIDGEPTVRIEGWNVDAASVGASHANIPIVAGQTYAWRGAFIGTPGVTYSTQMNMYEFGTTNGVSSIKYVVATEGVTEFEHVVTVPAGKTNMYAYLISPVNPGATEFWLSSRTHLARRSTTTVPLVPWAKVTNPEAALNEAALMYLAQLAGVRVPQGLAFRDMQTFIERAEARRRGRLDYMVELAQTTLTGTKTVVTMERVTSAWTLRILTRSAETPDPAATKAAILRGKPAGIVLDYEAVAGITWDEAVSQWNGTPLTWEESGDTVP